MKPYFLYTWMACVRVQEGEGLDIKPPHLGVGGSLPLVVHRSRASHVIQRVWASIREEKIQLPAAQ